MSICVCVMLNEMQSVGFVINNQQPERQIQNILFLDTCIRDPLSTSIYYLLHVHNIAAVDLLWLS